MMPQLERRLTLLPVTSIVIANMVGAGIFTTSGLLMKDLQNPMVMLALWLIGGMIALCGALCYGELGAAFPQAGGEYAFLSRLYHPLLGFLSGWVSLFAGFSASIAASAIGFSEYLFRAVPYLPELGTSQTHTTWIKRMIAMAIIALFTSIHLRGIAFGARIQYFLTAVKLILIIGLVLAGFTVGEGEWLHLSAGKAFSFEMSHLTAAGLALMWIMYAYSGWNAATYIGSEIRDPRKNLPLSLLLGTGLVVVLYFFLNLFYVYSIDPAGMEGVISISGLAAERAFGRTMDTIISLMIAFALFSSLSAFIILGPRVYYAMGKDNVFFSGLSHIHPVSHVPSKAIILQGVIAAGMTLTGSFDQILTYMGFALGIFPLLAVFGVFKLRETKQAVLKLPGYPITPIFYLIAVLAILLLSFMKRPVESSLALATAITGVPVYFYFRYRSRQVAREI
jgi:basic amino acid/polyamine antiporter, APA family